MTLTINDIRADLENRKDRSAWSRGVTAYALDLLDDLQEAIKYNVFRLDDWRKPRALRAALLDGARDWKQFSWGGCSLICDEDIARRLCTPSELNKTRNGERRPNSREEWFDTQARALFQAADRLYRAGVHVINANAASC